MGALDHFEQSNWHCILDLDRVGCIVHCFSENNGYVQELQNLGHVPTKDGASITIC